MHYSIIANLNSTSIIYIYEMLFFGVTQSAVSVNIHIIQIIHLQECFQIC